MTSRARNFGLKVTGWSPPPHPGWVPMEGRYARLEPLAEHHATELFAANRSDGAIWDFLPYGPFSTEADYSA